MGAVLVGLRQYHARNIICLREYIWCNSNTFILTQTSKVLKEEYP